MLPRIPIAPQTPWQAGQAGMRTDARSSYVLSSLTRFDVSLSFVAYEYLPFLAYLKTKHVRYRELKHRLLAQRGAIAMPNDVVDDIEGPGTDLLNYWSLLSKREATYLSDSSWRQS